MFKYGKKDKKIEIVTDNQAIFDTIITMCKTFNKSEQYDELMTGRISKTDNKNICLCEDYSPNEIFDIIYRNHHTKRTAVILLSDFLGVDTKTAQKIYEIEYPTYKKRRLTNCN